MISQFPTWFLYVLAGILGSIMGSFANVCIVRMPKDKSVITPASHCPNCGHKLSWWENIPILSFLLLKAKCLECRQPISIQYPIVEIICTVLSLLAWWYFRNPLPYLLYFCFLIVPLVIITVIDLKYMIIPDVISISGIFVGIGVNMIMAGRSAYLSAALDSILGALVGGVSLFIVAYVYEKLKNQEGLGGGDVKLIAMLGAFFGWRASILILLISSVVGSIVGILLILILRKDMKYAIPFGPFLALAGLIQLFAGRELLHWYLNLFF